MSERLAGLVVSREDRAERMERALRDLALPVPGTKGLGPSDRAQRLHAEMERRRAVATEALRPD